MFHNVYYPLNIGYNCPVKNCDVICHRWSEMRQHVGSHDKIYGSCCLYYSRITIIRTSINRNLNYPALQIACVNDIYCNSGVRHLEYLLQVLHRAIILRLSRLFAYPDGFQNKGVRITEFLLYLISKLATKILNDSTFISSCAFVNMYIMYGIVLMYWSCTVSPLHSCH